MAVVYRQRVTLLVEYYPTAEAPPSQWDWSDLAGTTVLATDCDEPEFVREDEEED